MKCFSSCLSCLCGTKTSARVSPSDSGQVIQPGESIEKIQARVVSEEKGDIGDGGRTNPSFIIGDDTANNSVGNGVGKSTLQVKALFIEVGKDRILRVIHIPSSKDTEGSESGGSSSKSSLKSGVGNEKDGEMNEATTEGKTNDQPGGEEEEEEEYWFSKWARKPRFRSIFAKNPEQRPKINHEHNNNSTNAEENNKLSAELEMKRAAAAAKRRAWAYNNNGNCEMTVTQQPTVNTSDEEEFSSIAIVNTTKQQWSKTGSTGNGSGNNPFTQNSSENLQQNGDADRTNPFEYNPFANTSPGTGSSGQIDKEQDNSTAMGKVGIENPAFQDDDDDIMEVSGSNDKTDYKGGDESPNLGNASRVTSSTASLKSKASTRDEDAITPVGPNENEKKSVSSPSNTSTPPGFVINVTPKKPLLFFIHSVAGCSDVWHQQMEYFQQLGYEIVAPDLLGHGLSTTPLNPKYYMFESLVQDLILIFDHFAKEDTKVVLIGHGYGASLAAMLTRVRLKNVVLFISIAGGGPTPLVRRTCCQDSWLSWKCKLFHSNRIRGRFDNPELRHVLPPPVHENVLFGQVWPDGDSAFYRRITVPTLLVYGMRDKVVTLVEECEMERSIPKSFLELIENAGHQVMQEEPDKLNKMLYKFISSWS